MNVQVKFLGGAETVTGSRYLFDIGNYRLLFDCGMFQGLKELRLKNWDEFPVDPSTIHTVIISHAHIDHTGYLPKLVREGFTGDVFCTEPTAALMEIMLRDSAKLQEEEAAYARQKGYSKHAEPKPLYTTDDVERVFPLLKTYPYGEEFAVHTSIRAVFKDAGHLLGSAITELYIQGDSQLKKITFSGDLGRYNDPILNAPTAISETDVLFVESTYGDKTPNNGNVESELERIINETFQKNGLILIPAFAVGRTQLMMFYLSKLMKEKRIPNVPVYVDSPMAISATYLYASFPEYHRMGVSVPGLSERIETDMFVLVKTVEHSKSLNSINSSAIIISSSGMMAGGRILHHLYHRLRRPQDTVLISGYQAAGTRGRDLLEKKPDIRIFGESVRVMCRVENIRGLSGHADRDELFRWMSGLTSGPKVVFTVHGEEPGISHYADAIRKRFGWNVVTPAYQDQYTLFEGI